MRERSWEYVGRNVDEAVQIALEELGLERDDIHVEILEEPQKGFLGLGGKEARVRVELIGEWEVLGEKAKKREAAKEEPQLEEEEEEIVPPELEKREIRPLERAPESAAKPVQMAKDVLEIMGIDAMVEAKEREDSIVIDIWGEDVAILIGKAGATLDALQYLTNVSCRRTGEVSRRIVIDVEGYRKRRKARLEKQAEETARKVISQDKSIELPPMNPSERKIVHMALRQIDGVLTESTGEEPDRRVVIRPDH